MTTVIMPNFMPTTALSTVHVLNHCNVTTFYCCSHVMIEELDIERLCDKPKVTAWSRVDLEPEHG